MPSSPQLPSPHPPAPPPKNDPPPLDLAGLQQHAAMFKPVADLLAWRDLEAPAPSYPSLFQEWQENTEEVIETACDASEVALTQKEEASMEVVKDIGYKILGRFVERAQAAGWASQDVATRREALERLLALPQIPQRTPAWYAQGKEVLTASEFASLFGTPRAWAQLVLSKVALSPEAQAAQPQRTNRLACMSCEMGPFDWGIRFEPVVKQVLAKRWGTEIAESGRLLHPKDSHLAASPDGLILAATDPARVGRLIEIKCPITRAIGAGIPFEYWCQMQIQMEVTGIEECDYVEVKLESIQKHAVSLKEGSEPDGHLWLLQQPTTCEMAYAYTEEERSTRQADGWDLVETIPWRVADLYTRTVTRDRSWFRSTAALRTKFWEDVVAARAGQFKAPEPTKPRVARAATTIVVHKEDAAAAAACLFLDD